MAFYGSFLPGKETFSRAKLQLIDPFARVVYITPSFLLEFHLNSITLGQNRKKRGYMPIEARDCCYCCSTLQYIFTRKSPSKSISSRFFHFLIKYLSRTSRILLVQVRLSLLERFLLDISVILFFFLKEKASCTF